MRERWPLALALALTSAMAPLAAAAERIVAIGGAVTETLYALGAGDQLIAVDATSVYPEQAQALPDVGYLRALSAEPILALKPDLIIYEQDAGPPETIAQLEAAGVRLVEIPDEPSVAGVAVKIRAIAQAVGRQQAGAELIEGIEREMAAVAARLPRGDRPPRVLFALQFDEGSVLAAGRGTAADSIIALAGGENIGAGFIGYKPMGGEALLAAAPDYIITMERAVAGFRTPQAALELPAVKLTPAAAHGRLIVMDGLLLLGFGPRLSLATRQLADAIHGAD